MAMTLFRAITPPGELVSAWLDSYHPDLTNGFDEIFVGYPTNAAINPHGVQVFKFNAPVAERFIFSIMYNFAPQVFSKVVEGGETRFVPMQYLPEYPYNGQGVRQVQHYLDSGQTVIVAVSGMAGQFFTITVGDEDFELPTDIEWQVFTHAETDTEMFITVERIPNFGSYENVLVGVTRFLGSPYGNLYVLDGGEWNPKGSIRLIDIGIVRAGEIRMPQLLLPSPLVQVILNSLVNNVHDVVDNPFYEDYFGEFAWDKMFALFGDTIEDALQVSHWIKLFESLITLKSISEITPELIETVRIFHEEWNDFEWWEFGEYWDNNHYKIIPSDMIQISPLYQEQQELVLITGVLNLYDGLSMAEFGQSTFYGELAAYIVHYFRTNGIITDDWGLENEHGVLIYPQILHEKSFRHFIWNYLITSRLEDGGERVARISTTNREWAERLRVSRNGYERSRIDEGMDGLEARLRADAFIIMLRRNLTRVAQNDPEVFFGMIPPENIFFNTHNIVDLWNNEIGRVYGLNSSGVPSFVFIPPDVTNPLPGPNINWNIPAVRNHVKEVFEEAKNNNHILYHSDIFRLRSTWEIVYEYDWWISVR